MAYGFFDTKNIEGANTLLDKNDQKKLSTVLKSLALNNGCTKFRVQVKPATCADGFKLEACTFVYGYNPELHAEFFVKINEKFDGTIQFERVEDMWYLKDRKEEELLENYPFVYSTSAHKTMNQRRALKLWNRIR